MTDDKTKIFAHELSDLCRRHGLAIAGNPELFMMEPEDYQLDYAVDRDSRLWFGGVPDETSAAIRAIPEKKNG